MRQAIPLGCLSLWADAAIAQTVKPINTVPMDCANHAFESLLSLIKHSGVGWDNVLGAFVFVTAASEIYRGMKTGVLENIPTLRGDRRKTPFRFYVSLFFIVIITLGAGGLALGLLPSVHW